MTIGGFIGGLLQINGGASRFGFGIQGAVQCGKLKQRHSQNPEMVPLQSPARRFAIRADPLPDSLCCGSGFWNVR